MMKLASLLLWLLAAAPAGVVATNLRQIAQERELGAVAANADPLEFHPMYRKTRDADNYEDDEELDDEGHRLLQSGQCTSRVVTVLESEYDVHYKAGSHSYGVTPIYPKGNQNDKIGDWYWEWVEESYGTMLIYWNPQESIFFGFQYRQTNYPIAGGYMDNNNCPGGYAKWLRQDGDVRYYKLYVCAGC